MALFRAAPALAAALLLLGFARAARAHGDPLPLSLWGDFSPSAVRCQRGLGSAALQCALAVLAARRTCIDAQLDGAACDADAEEAAVRDARQRALNRAAGHCSDVDATRLQFLGMAEALADLTRVCRELDTALTTAAYGPALLDTTVITVDAPTRSCLTAVARGAAQVLRCAGRAQRTALDRVAAQPLTIADRDEWLARARTHLAMLHPTFTARLAAHCSPTDFSRLYGRSLDAFVADLTSRAECLAGAVYVQGAVICPAARCGNGMQEPLEECDDGNAVDTDWCLSDCRRALVVEPANRVGGAARHRRGW